MPSISKIRFTNVIYEGGQKRYNDETFIFDGHNGAVVLENGGGKTVFIQTAIQAVLPHADLAGRKVKDTLSLDNGPAHIAIEWILNDKPRRRYALTCVSLYQTATGIDSFRYVYEYGEHDAQRIDELPFVRTYMNKPRAADKGEMQDYYSSMEQRYALQAKTFQTIKEYKAYLEQHFQIISGEWEAIAKINDTEGGIEAFFDECKGTIQLFDRLLIPTVERSIEGYEQGSFAKMFEVHREGFEQYKQLKEQIDENRQILQELGGYVRLYERLDLKQRGYNESRSEAKAYWQLSLEQRKELEAEKQQMLQQAADWSQRQRSLHRKRQSLSLFTERQEKEALETALLAIDTEKENTQGRLLHVQQQYYSLQYSEIREKHEDVKARITGLEQQLARLSYTEDEAVLQGLWEKNGAKLRYAFAVSEQQLEVRAQEKEAELAEADEQLKGLSASIRSTEKELLGMDKLLSAKQTEQRMKAGQQEQIARDILANPGLEKVEQQLPLWIQEEQQLEQDRIALLQELKRLGDNRNVMEQRRKAAGEERNEADRKLVRLLEQEERQQTEHEALKTELARLRRAWERLGSLYEKQTSIRDVMEETLARLRMQKNKLLMEERLAFRYVDDHSGQRIFFADTVVSKLCEQWGGQFSLLQTGTDYVNGLADYVIEGESADRLWAVTIITTEHEQDALHHKLRQVKESYAFPIRILNTQEAAAVLKGQGANLKDQSTDRASFGEWVVPAHWLDNEHSDRFVQWKAQLAEQAEQARVHRESVEQELADWGTVQQKFAGFLLQFPLQVQQELEQQRLQEQGKLAERKRELERLEYELTVNRQSEESRRQTAEEMLARIHHLGESIKTAGRYMNLVHEVTQLQQEIGPLQIQMELLRKGIGRLEEEGQRVQAEIDDLKQARQDIRSAQQVLQRDERYAEVQVYETEQGEETLQQLKEERKALELQRYKIVQERTQLERMLSSERESQNDGLRNMERLRTEHRYVLQDLPLPLDAEERKTAGWAEIGYISEQLSKVEHEYKRIERDLQNKHGGLLKLHEQFAEQYPTEEPDSFLEPVSIVKQKLTEEAATLRREQEQLNKQQQHLEQQQHEFDQVLSLWNKHLLQHALEAVGLLPSVIGEKDHSEFRYKRQGYTERCIEQLGDSYKWLAEEQNAVQKGRQRLRGFFSSEVKDVKLRQMTLQGIDTKESYAEISEFQQSMDQRIQMAIHISEQNLQTHDQELQQYIQHIHAHLKLIVQELKEIPKKTRVKTDDGWKEIYSFTIPSWEDQDGKERIRKHIEWIMTKLERYGETEEQSSSWQEQQSLIRRDLEKWLDARQLIQVVLMGEGMKVSCRKVGNDQQVSKVAYSWEQSNRWSGGEKWSKNMTLFLGLLNYVAERKQYIQARMKRHRTVILDNPFGKASSEHVLSPVFFIAEQLGFQIIALTAHVEGKFLQDYFPIVYSCRLRHAADGSKQIIEAIQQIQAAYFQDHEPETLERIGNRVTQIELF